MARAFVSGGTGFVGSHLAQKLIALGHEVIITGNRTEHQVQAYKFLEPSLIGIDWSKVNNIDVLFHQGACNDTLCTDRAEMMRANVESSEFLFKKCLDTGCKHFIYASSTAVYGNAPVPYIEDKTPIAPINIYGESKAIFEERAKKFAKNFNVKVIGLRYCNVFGVGESHKGRRASMITQLIKQMAAGQRPELFKYGEQQRDYIHVSDVVEANLLAWHYPNSDIFNCGSGHAVSFSQLVAWINEYLGIALEPEWVKNPRPESYQSLTQCSVSKATDLLKFTPKIRLNDGIKELCTNKNDLNR